MIKKNHINVEVVYATPDKQCIISIELATPATVIQAIHTSNILNQYPEIDLAQQKVGIFSRTISLNTLLQEGDRVEIYRPLLLSPIEKRFQRVQKERKDL